MKTQLAQMVEVLPMHHCRVQHYWNHHVHPMRHNAVQTRNHNAHHGLLAIAKECWQLRAQCVAERAIRVWWPCSASCHGCGPETGRDRSATWSKPCKRRVDCGALQVARPQKDSCDLGKSHPCNCTPRLEMHNPVTQWSKLRKDTRLPERSTAAS